MYRPDDTIGPYTLVKTIGIGSFAIVWLAERRGSIVTTKVALKLPKEEAIDLDAIKQEAAVWMEASGHPNVLPIIEADIYNRQIVIVSEYAPDGSLKDWLARFGGKAPSIESALEMMLGILLGLKHLHSRHIIHRDLKPDNVLLQGETPRLVDFGMSRVLKASFQSEFIRGTPSYMSPEAVKGERSEQMDIWSAGVIFYQLVAGYLPFQRDGIHPLMWAIVNDDPSPLPLSVPSLVREIILRSLQKDRSLRYVTADDMLAALRKFRHSFQTETTSDDVVHKEAASIIEDEPTILKAYPKIEISLQPSKEPEPKLPVPIISSSSGSGPPAQRRREELPQQFKEKKEEGESKGSASGLKKFLRHIFADQREARREEQFTKEEESNKQREREEMIWLEQLRKQQEEERKLKAEEAPRLKERQPIISKPVIAEPVMTSAAVTNSDIATTGAASIERDDLHDSIDHSEPQLAESDRASTHRQRAAAILRARTAKLEQARAGQSRASEIVMDPEVAEMISTASIVRTAPVEKVEQKVAKEQDAHHKTRIESSSGAAYKLPATDLLETPIGHHEEAEEELRERAAILAEKCKEFSAPGHIHKINPGPVVTTFEFKPDPGVEYTRINRIADDLCLALKAESISITRIPGESTIAIEVMNKQREKVFLREIIESGKFQRSESKLTIALGKTINGEEYIADLAKMPHLLIAGTVDTGKSVTLNSIICSILYKASPEDVKFIMVDPKRVELGLYEGIPHLLTPIVTDPKRASNALKWAVNEMENRYRELATLGVRNIEQYNRQVQEMMHPTVSEDNPEAKQPLPYIVIAIDELADLMMVARGDVETSIARLAQMARAVGIHLVLVTRRLSADVITGIIKANIPSRIAFRVASKADSRTIVDSNGAEALLGQGDMLFLPPGTARLIRVHGSFVNEMEVKHIADHTRQQAEPDYNEQVTLSEAETQDADGFEGPEDELFGEALEIVIEMGRASTSVLQRRLSIGYGRAAKILNMMERRGFIGPAEGSKPRKVLQGAHEFRERLGQILEEDLD